MRTSLIPAAAVIALSVGVAPQVTLADMYTQVDFSGQIAPGNANVQAPFAGNGFNQGDSFSGTFIFDNQQVPGAASGLTNVFFSGFPDSANIPAASTFSIHFGNLDFTGADDLTNELPAGIQYNNGHFNGLEFITDFSFQGGQYQFHIDGSNITTRLLDAVGDPIGSSLINASLNIGDSSLTNATPFILAPVPIPASLGLFVAAFAGVMLVLRRRPVTDVSEGGSLAFAAMPS
jgi:hypothetical protein